MALAQTDTFDQRSAILSGLTSRNRLVGALRIGVPAVGITALGLLVIQIYAASILGQYGVSAIRIDRGNLVVETPQYSGTGGDGSQYRVSAREARAPLNAPNAIAMTDAVLDLIRPGRSPFHATGATATFDTNRQYVTVPNLTNVESEDGLRGTLMEVRADMAKEVVRAEGPVDLTFPDGTTLTAANMLYEGKKGLWTFEKATLIVPDLPKSPQPPVPDFALHGWVVL
jgi:hypothetical protein